MSIIRKISAILMAMFVLLTTAGFSLNKHHCTITKETITSVNHVKGCCGTADESDCPKGCCEDETEYVQLNSEISLPATALTITPDQFVAIIQYSVLCGLLDQDVKTSNKYLNYRPPLLLRDIPVLVQSFLI